MMGRYQGANLRTFSARAYFLILTSAIAIFLAASSSTALAWAEGSVITWGSPTNISGDSDVRTDGTLVGAFDMNGPAVTVNGVTFSAFPITPQTTTATSGNFSFSESPGHLIAPSTLGSTSPPFSNLSANYQTLLSSAISTDDNNTLTLTISGLTLGHNYEFEFWVNASSYSGSGPGFRTTAAAPNSVTLDDNTANAIGSTGQFVVGTFNGGSTTEVITFTGADTTQAPTVNAFQLRDLSVVPEPTTLALIFVGTAFGGLIRRKR